MAVKDEAGDPLERSAGLLTRTHGRLEDFSGAGGHSFFAEMELGFRGTCPYAGLADVLQHSFDLYQAGKTNEAFDAFGRFLAFDSLPHANDYVMKARGIFPEEITVRSNPPVAGVSATSGRHSGPITQDQKAEIKLALNSYLKPYLIA